MSLDTGSKDSGHDNAKEVVDRIVEFLITANIGWGAQIFTEHITVNDIKLKAVGVLIRRNRATSAHKNRLAVFFQKMYWAVEPIVEIRSVFETANVHCLVLDLRIGGRRYSDPGPMWASLLSFFERRKLNKLLKMLKEALPVELKYLS